MIQLLMGDAGSGMKRLREESAPSRKAIPQGLKCLGENCRFRF